MCDVSSTIESTVIQCGDISLQDMVAIVVAGYVNEKEETYRGSNRADEYKKDEFYRCLSSLSATISDGPDFGGLDRVVHYRAVVDIGPRFRSFLKICEDMNVIVTVDPLRMLDLTVLDRKIQKFNEWAGKAILTQVQEDYK